MLQEKRDYAIQVLPYAHDQMLHCLGHIMNLLINSWSYTQQALIIQHTTRDALKKKFAKLLTYKFFIGDVNRFSQLNRLNN